MISLDIHLNQSWRIFFFLLSTIFTLSTFVEPYPYSGLIKILPMLLLILFSYRQIVNGFPKLFVVGLIFSMAGDFILDYDRQQAFIYGLAAFFVAHVFYIASLGKWRFAGKPFLPTIIIIILSTIAIWLIIPNLGKMLIPVLAYMIVLLLMSLSTVFSRKSNHWLILGGVSFLISDSLIGLNKFYTPIPYSHLLIMASYYFAQYSLVNGLYQLTNSRDTII